MKQKRSGLTPFLPPVEEVVICSFNDPCLNLSPPIQSGSPHSTGILSLNLFILKTLAVGMFYLTLPRTEFNPITHETDLMAHAPALFSECF